jgi:hypothetical protein
MARQLDMVIDVDLGLFPFRKLVGGLRQGTQGRAVDAFVQTPAAAVLLLERPVVENLQQASDLPVEFIETEKTVMAQPEEWRVV